MYTRALCGIILALSYGSLNTIRGLRRANALSQKKPQNFDVNFFDSSANSKRGGSSNLITPNNNVYARIFSYCMRLPMELFLPPETEKNRKWPLNTGTKYWCKVINLFIIKDINNSWHILRLIKPFISFLKQKRI